MYNLITLSRYFKNIIRSLLLFANMLLVISHLFEDVSSPKLQYSRYCLKFLIR